jgi:hypothetical protein
MGLVLYELVAGRGPFDELRGRGDALRFAHCEQEPPPPSRFAPQPIPAALEQLILRAIAKAPEHRFQTAADMEAAVRRVHVRLHDGSPSSAGPVVSASALTPTATDAVAACTPVRSEVPAELLRRPLLAAPAGAARLSRRPRARSTRRAPPARPVARAASRASALAVCALAVALAALGLALAQRWIAASEPSAPAPPSAHAGAQARSAVR